MKYSDSPLVRRFVFGLFVILASANLTCDVKAFDDGSSQSSSIPAEFQDLYPALQDSLSSYNSALNSRWDGSKSPVLLGAELSPADGYIAIYNAARTNQLGAYYDARVTPFLNAY